MTAGRIFGLMDGWGFMLAMIGLYAVVAIPILWWAAWRLRRRGPVFLHPAIPAVMLGMSAGLLGLWAIRGDWLGMISAAGMMVVFGISLAVAASVLAFFLEIRYRRTHPVPSHG